MVYMTSSRKSQNKTDNKAGELLKLLYTWSIAHVMEIVTEEMIPGFHKVVAFTVLSKGGEFIDIAAACKFHPNGCFEVINAPRKGDLAKAKRQARGALSKALNKHDVYVEAEELETTYVPGIWEAMDSKMEALAVDED